MRIFDWLFGRRRILEKLTAIHERLMLMPTQQDLDAAVSLINDATNAEAAMVDEVLSEVAAATAEVAALRAQLTAGATIAQSTIDALGAIGTRLASSTTKLGPVSDALKSIASDSSNPVP